MKRRSQAKTNHGTEGDIMRIAKIGMVAVGVLGSISGAVWGVGEYTQTLARKADVAETARAIRDDLVVVAVKADTAIDRQMEDLIARITYLDSKPHKTAEERDQLKYLREQLERVRRIRTGK